MIEGFIYRPDIVNGAEEEQFLNRLRAVPTAPLQMYGQPTKRRIASFGLDYRPSTPRLEPAPPLPEFLVVLRRRAASVAGIESETLVQALVTWYPAGAQIGWHVDHPQFGDTVVAVSLGGPATLELRPKGGPTILRHVIAPRSVYVLLPNLRYGHEHRVLAHEERVSVTFRSIAR